MWRHAAKCSLYSGRYQYLVSPVPGPEMAFCSEVTAESTASISVARVSSSGSIVVRLYTGPPPCRGVTVISQSLFQTIIISDNQINYNDRPSHLLLLWLLGLGCCGLGGEQQQRQHRHHRLQHLPSHPRHGGSSGRTRSETALHYWLEWWRGPSWQSGVYKEFCVGTVWHTAEL